MSIRDDRRILGEIYELLNRSSAPRNEPKIQQLDNLTRSLHEMAGITVGAKPSDKPAMVFDNYYDDAFRKLCDLRSVFDKCTKSAELTRILDNRTPPWIKDLQMLERRPELISCLRDELQQWSEWSRDEEWLKTIIVADAGEVSELLREKPNRRSCLFLLARLLDELIVLVKQKEGHTKAELGINSQCLEIFPGLKKLGKDCDAWKKFEMSRNCIMHVRGDESALSVDEWAEHILVAYAQLWRGTQLSKALQLACDCTRELLRNSEELATQNRLSEKAEAAIRQKIADLKKNDLSFRIPKEKGKVEICPDKEGAYLHLGDDADAVSIHWHPDVGAHATRGIQRRKWAELKWEQGVLGYPTSDEIPLEVEEFRRLLGTLDKRVPLRLSKWNPLRLVPFGRRGSCGTYTQFQNGRLYAIDKDLVRGVVPRMIVTNSKGDKEI